jgi:hypothetical protein
VRFHEWPNGSDRLAVGASTQVRDAFRELERRHTHGKIVLRP